MKIYILWGGLNSSYSWWNHEPDLITRDPRKIINSLGRDFHFEDVPEIEFLENLGINKEVFNEIDEECYGPAANPGGYAQGWRIVTTRKKDLKKILKEHSYTEFCTRVEKVKFR